jgi:hypothetical protein
MVAGRTICLVFHTLVNWLSHLVQILGFMRLGFIPNSLNGIDIGPLIGIKIWSWDRHPLHIVAGSKAVLLRRPPASPHPWGRASCPPDSALCCEMLSLTLMAVKLTYSHPWGELLADPAVIRAQVAQSRATLAIAHTPEQADRMVS